MSDDFSQDENRKTLRSFYCRDYLWDLFEQMTRELGCSMDYLVNEAMRQYAQNQDYSPSNAQPEQDRDTQGNYSNPSASGGASAPSKGGGQDPEYRTFEQVPAVGGQQQSGPSQAPPPPSGSSQPQQRPQQQQQQPGSQSGGPPPPPPGQNRNQQNQQSNWQRDQQPPTKRQNQSPGGGNFQQQQQQSGRSTQQQSGRSTQQQSGRSTQQQSGRDTLYLLFNNNRYEIERDRFVIGRGSSSTDLTIRDGNISRQHCAIIYRNNNWYLKDLDSTNGVEYRGNRIESKRIEEGDVFYLCDYPLQFTHRG